MFEALGNWVAFSFLGLLPDTSIGAMVQFFVMDVVQIFVLLLIIIYVMGLLRAYVSSEKVRKIVMNKPQWQARSLAILLGGVTPFCSCSSVPLFIGFVQARIPLGITFAFLIASPMINEVAVVMLFSLLGWQVALLYLLAGIAVAYFGSMLIELFKPERWVESFVWNIPHAQDFSDNSQKLTAQQRHQFAWQEVEVIVKRIWVWVVVGVAIGALFHGFVPEAWVVEHLADAANWWSVPMAVLLGVPLYGNAIGVIPIIEALLNKGVPLGTSLALMMSIATLSLPELLMLRQVIRGPALMVFVGVVSVAMVLVGYAFNFGFA